MQPSELEAALRPLLKERTETVFAEGERRLKKPRTAWTKAEMEQFLKRAVFPALQFDLPPAQARAEVERLLAALKDEGDVAGRLGALEAAARRFALFIDWPEALRLRRLVAGLKEEWDEAQAAEAEAVVAELEEKLESRLVAQEKALAELKEVARRVEKVGGRKVRRLSMLLRELEFAQQEGLLASAELEEAQALAHELAKLIESSAIEPSDTLELDLDFDFEAELTPEQADRLRALDLEEERRRLERLKERYAPLLGHPELASRLEAIEARHAAGELAGEALAELEAALKRAFEELLAEARARIEWADERLHELGRPPALAAQLAALREALEKGVYPEGLAELEAELEARHQAAARAKAAEKARQAQLEAIRRFLDEAGDQLDPALRRPLEAALASGEPNETLLAKARQAYAAGLKDRAAALEARLAALPAELVDSTPARLALDAGRLDEAEALLRRLEDEARRLLQAQLEELKSKAERFGLSPAEIEAAQAELSKGRWPALEPLRLRLESEIERRRREVRAELQRLKRVARRYRGLGGEELLERIQAAETGLDEALPDLTDLKAWVQGLEARREALKTELQERFHALASEFERYRGMTGETRSRLGALLRFLEAGFKRIDRLGTQGLFELRRGLDEAEGLIEQLRAEHAAARDLAQELKDVNFDELLGVFDEPPSAAGEALGFRAGRLDAFGLEGELDLDAAALGAWVTAARALAPEAKVLSLIEGERAIVVRVREGYEEVLVGPKEHLSELLRELLA